MLKMILPCVIFAAIFSAFSVRALYAEDATVLSFSPTPPSEQIVFKNQKTDKAQQNVGLYSFPGPNGKKSRWVGNRFTLGRDCVLNEVAISLHSVASGALDSTLQFQIVEITKSEDGHLTKIIQESAGLPFPQEARADGFLVFDIPDLPLRGKQEYGFLVAFESPKVAQQINFWQCQRGTGEPVTGCLWSTDEGQSYQPDITSLHFYLQGR